MRRQQPGARGVSSALARTLVAAVATLGPVFVVASGQQAATAAGIVPPTKPTADVQPQVLPHCTTTTVDDDSAACIDSVLHNVNYGRFLEGLGPMVLPSDYASDSPPLQQLVIADEERGDRGLPQFSGLDAALDSAALTGAQNNQDPQAPAGYQSNPWGSNFALDFTPLGADFAWMYNDGYGGTNALCTTPTDGNCWGHRDNILGSWTSTGTKTAEMGDADTSGGQYTQLFAVQDDPADSLADTLTPSSLPTPSTPAPPDVVQVLPASSSTIGAGTPVTIEGNYFNTPDTPQVYFGGVAATNVHVDWNGELTADAPADPAGSGTDQVVVTVSTSTGSSSATGIAQVNEFTYAPVGAPAITSISSTSGTEIPNPSSPTITIHGTNLISGGVGPIVSFGNEASIGLSGTSTQITANIPPAVTPGTVNVTITTAAGTSAVSPAVQYTYTGSDATVAPSITSGEPRDVLGRHGVGVPRHDDGDARCELGE